MTHEPGGKLPYPVWSRIRRARRRYFPERFWGARPMLSVVVPMYNVERYIGACLESVLAEQAVNLEVIVIDDGSADSSRGVAETAARMDRRVWVFHQRNRGLGAARNAGMRLSAGRYVAFLDSDDIAMPGAYRAMVDAAEGRQADVVIGGIFQLTDGKRHFPEWMRYIHDKDRFVRSVLEFPDLLRDFYTPNKMVRRDWWRSHRFRFRTGVIFEDQPVITEALASASGIAVMRMMTYQWRRRSDGSSLTQTMYTSDRIDQRAHATALTRPVVEALNDARFRDAWTYTLVENHFLTYFRRLSELGPPERAALVKFVRAAGPEELFRRPPQVSPAAAVLATLAHRGDLDAVGRLVQAGWTRGGHVEIRTDAGCRQLEAALLDPALVASLAPCFDGRDVDPRRFVIRTEKALWSADGDLHLTVHVPFIEVYGMDGARLEAAVWGDGSPRAAASIVGLAGPPPGAAATGAGDDDGEEDEGPTAWGPRFHVTFAAGDLARIAAPAQGGTPCPLGFAIVHGDQRYETHTAVRPSPLPDRAARTWRRPDGSALLLRWRDRYWLRLDPLDAPT
ncbi:MAG: glycosyltransferase [Bifidobacteriaceae bacterium]|nr:glycosyltransferase [Bifidobacteriaceae bacterium]